MLTFGSGTYNVRDSEVVRDATVRTYRSFVCTVHFLDDTSEDFELDRHARGQQLLDRVFQHLELIEKDYFALQFMDILSKQDNLCWLDPAKLIRKQLLCPPYVLYFRVKFYVNDPSKLHEEYTRYHFYLQLRKDISEGRLVCSESSAALLGSYAVQSEFGDYIAEEHGETYLDGFQFAPNQTASLIKRVAELHKLHKGQTPADAEFSFLDHAKRLDMYGVDLYKAQDSNLAEMQLGVTAYGIVVFQRSIRINVFSWAKILKIKFKRKQFFIRLKPEDNNVETVVGFNLASTRTSRCLWKSCVEHHTFFRLIAPPLPPTKGLFQLGSQFRYSGRTEYQTLEEMKRRARIERTFHRAGSKASFARSTFTQGAGGGRFLRPLSGGSGSASAEPSPLAPSKFRQTSSASVVPVSAINGAHPRLNFISEANGNGRTQTRPRRGLGTSGKSPVQSAANHETTFGCSSGLGQDHSELDDEKLTERSFELPRNSPSRACTLINNNTLPISNSQACYPCTSSGDVKKNCKPTSNGVDIPFSCQQGALRNSYATRSGCGSSPRSRLSSEGCDSPRRRALLRKAAPQSNGIGVGPDDGLVAIRMRPDSQGRFGFNVKGGADQNHPVIVSRVLAGSPADSCLPRLNEGDQVLMIQGRDVSRYSHEQVVQFIRACRESARGDLVLTVRPNAYIGEDVDEPDFRYVPQTPKVAEYVPRSDLLNQSILLLRDALDSGAAVSQFELLYRKKPGMVTTVCLLTENMNKNRYRDILPYDSTRVILEKSESGGDYINASFINMEIPAMGIVNRYIAAQGPLPHTCADFWRVVWEQLCPVIVMLTATSERGRAKCHQYWPPVGRSLDQKSLRITCLQDNETTFGAFREFSVQCRETKEERLVTQMQYSVWPDHGVPDDPDEFIKFASRVRQSRAGTVEPLLVHCSAGIGRTGVLILMETAMCLIEASEPVYPLDIVRVMRDQRAMLIQTSVQYKFVCEAVCKAYNDGIVKPLAEYQTKSESNNFQLD